MARCPAPGLPLPNYVTIEDLLKSSGEYNLCQRN